MKIRYLDLGIVSPFGVQLFLGRRKSGKSTAIMSILNHFKDIYDFGIIFCGSTATANIYSQCCPATYIYDEIDTKMLNDREYIAYNLIKDTYSKKWNKYW